MIEIDKDSGFCFGVVTAIKKAEEVLDKEGTLYCLGDIVHNAAEVERLCSKGLKTITHADLENLHDVKVLLRAHGEPPSTYQIAQRNNIEIIDATCPVVLQLQRRIKTSYQDLCRTSAPVKDSSGAYDAKSPDAKECKDALIIIYGKRGHAEVNGLVGQTRGRAVVVQDVSELDSLDLDRDIILYSQTTKSLDGFRNMVETIRERKSDGKFTWHDTICRQVANRMDKIRAFAASHDVVVFVAGTKSSNGKVLYSECRLVNSQTYMIAGPEEIRPEWVENAKSVGVCGATSTPHWLMEKVAAALETLSAGPNNEAKQ